MIVPVALPLLLLAVPLAVLTSHVALGGRGALAPHAADPGRGALAVGAAPRLAARAGVAGV